MANGSYTYTGGAVTYTVKTTGVYDITAYGAQGGSSIGGKGAEIGGDFSLQAGAVLKIIVGGQGAYGNGCSGGGGGSFVIETFNGTSPSNTPLVIAGGGGGGGGYNNMGSRHLASGSPGQTGTAGDSGYAPGNGAGGTNGSGGQAGFPLDPTNNTGGGGGGGFKTAGGSALTYFGGGGGAAAGGAGGSAPYTGGVGGYGGGGGSGGLGGGGGGGGYSGGGGGGGAMTGTVAGGGGGGSVDTGAVEVAIAGENAGNGQVSIALVCYRRGTCILTPTGEVAIEKLRIGDLVVTADRRARPVRWLGRRAVACSGHPDPQSAWPVRIAAGAVAEDQPSRDLWVSPGHSIRVDDVLIQAECLLNGATISQEPCDYVEYWHVELDSHDLLFANGLAAESYLDTGNRSSFINGGRFVQAYPDFRPAYWADTCLPLILEGPRIAQAKAALLARAEQFGHRIIADDDLHVMADGERINPNWLSDSRRFFLVPDGIEHVVLHSRHFVPAEVQPASGDRRVLGVCVGRLQIDGEDLALDQDELFSSGWHGFEHKEKLRWTQGATPLPAGCRLVVIDTAGRGHYWPGRPNNVVPLFGATGVTRVAGAA
jgi:hypothetical protein